MEEITKFHLHKDDYSKLHFDIFEAAPFCEKNSKHCFKAHLHTFYQIIWFENAGHHYVDYEIIEHPANSVFFLNQKQVHYFCPYAKNEGTLFHFDEIFLLKQNPDLDHWLRYKLFNEIGLPYIQIPQEEIQNFKNITQLLKLENSNKSYNYRDSIFHLFQVLLLRIERFKQIQHNTNPIQDSNFILAMDFKRLIGTHIDKTLTIEEYSQLLHISNKKLTSISKKYLKDSPSNIVHQRKILEAKRRLSNLNISIKEVAFSLGFDQPTYFTKYFKKHTGLTPKSFVKLHH